MKRWRHVARHKRGVKLISLRGAAIWHQKRGGGNGAARRMAQAAAWRGNARAAAKWHSEKEKLR